MAKNLTKYPIHLGLGATAIPQPEFGGGMEWYEGYGMRHDNDGAEGRLVSMHIFTQNWGVWEMHPKGSEVVLCTKGRINLVQEIDGKEQRTVLNEGEYAINAPGVWHTADIDGEATALFITSGFRTEHRGR